MQRIWLQRCRKAGMIVSLKQMEHSGGSPMVLIFGTILRVSWLLYFDGIRRRALEMFHTAGAEPRDIITKFL
jgi:hypothetical protein